MKVRANGPHPIRDFFGGILTPVRGWWGLINQIPNLVYVGVACFVALVCVQVLKLFKRN